MKRPFVMIEPMTGEIQSSKEVKFGASKTPNKSQQALNELIKKSIEEQFIPPVMK